MHAVAAEYPPSTPNSTPTCNSHGGTALYETYKADREESGWARSRAQNTQGLVYFE